MKIRPILRWTIGLITAVAIAGCNSSGTDTGTHDPGLAKDGFTDQVVPDNYNTERTGLDTGRLADNPVDRQETLQDSTGKKKSGLTRGCSLPTSDLVINEIMAAPGQGIDEADGEWFEVYNPHGYGIDMFHWWIKDNGSEQHQIGKHVIVPAGGYAVFCSNGDSNSNGGVDCNYEYSGVTLANTDDAIVLEDTSKNEVDRVQWNGTVPTGASMELRNPVDDNKVINIPSKPNDPNAWKNLPFGLSIRTYGNKNQKGTPGAKNADVYQEKDFAGCDDGNICTWDVCYEDHCDNSQWKKDCCLSDADCDDRNQCTTDSCNTGTHSCTHTAIAGCCNTNEDCQGWDDNPCNYDYCDGYHHCRSSATMLAGCCWAPADTNPDTGLAWNNEKERQAWADAQCSSTNPCTIQTCNLDTHQCTVTGRAQNCCVLDTDCNDNNICTRDTCVNNQCVHTRIANCCQQSSECKDNDPCTIDRCVWNECRHFFNYNNVCCSTDTDCIQNSNPCIATKCINSRCEDTIKEQCNTTIPYKETFDHPENSSRDRLDFIGYHVTDYPYDKNSKITHTMEPGHEHWVVVDTPNQGDLGPDQFAMFKWNPTIHNVKTVMTSPVLDCSVSNNSWNGSKQTYLEWTQSYLHKDASGSVTLKVVATEDGDFENAPILWQKTLNSDLPETIEKVPLPAKMKFSSHVQIGFFVQTKDTYYMNAWHIDDVILSPGTPNYVWRSSIRECKVGDNLCRSSKLVAEDTQHNEVPDIGMYVNQFYRIWVDVQEPDYSGGTLYYLPLGSFLGAPFDRPSFVYLTKNMDGDQHVGCFRLTAYDHLFRCMFDINPGGLESNAGDYTLGYLVKDDSKGGVFSLHQSLSRIHLVVLGLDGYLVWSPEDVDQTEGDALVAAIRSNNRWAQKIKDISIVPNFDHIRGVFVNLGVYGQEHILTDAEAQKLADYLDNGGHIYLEGGDFWWTTDMGGRQPKTVLHDYFKTKAIMDGTSKLAGPLNGANFLYGYNYDYSTDYRWNTWLDHIKHKPEKGGREVMRVTEQSWPPHFATVITWDGGADGYRTIASSVFYSGFKQQNGGKSPSDLMNRYIYFLENGYPPCDQDAQCEDFEPCTRDACKSHVCNNRAIPNCIPCINDVYKEDGTLSCGTDQACHILKGYSEGRCVNIQPRQVKATPADDQENLAFGSMQTQVQSRIHVSRVGFVRGMQVKVKITHSYRGDVSLQLKHAGKTVALLDANPKDARENVYETYTIGVPIDTGDSLDVFRDQSMEGDWDLVATDNEPQGDDGVLDTWSLYARYCAPKTCTEQGLECGNQTDTCGHPLDCGTCPSSDYCDNGKCKPWCGDGTCEPGRGENCGTCQQDCKCGSKQVCYSNACCTPKTCDDLGKECGNNYEDSCGGKLDCGGCTTDKYCDKGTCKPWCGDGLCEANKGENCGTCQQDCKCGSKQVCYSNACCTPKTCTELGKKCGSGYDDTCGGKLDCGGCTTDKYCDKGTCKPWCGDGTCEADKGENCGTCPQDCKCTTGQTCYHDACCTPKSCSDLGKKCGSGYDDTCGGTVDCGTCDPDKYCNNNGQCKPWCGDGTCEADRGENCGTCPQDCKCGSKQVCYDNACCTPKTCTDLGKECGSGYDDTCGGTVDCGTCPSWQFCNNNGQCQSWCPDGTCETSKGESCSTCPQDCGCATGQKCYHDACCTPKTCAELGKTCGTWDDSCGGTVDCGTCPVCNNNGVCESARGENCANCQSDCGCATGQKCYHDACCTPKTCAELGKACGTWDDSCGGTVDCGICPACNNGICEPANGENCSTCPQDCKCGSKQVCYSNACCTPKTCTELGKKCGSGYDDTCGGTVDCGTCAPDKYCDNDGQCRPWCGDGTCEADKGENCGTCPQDCGCATGQKCYHDACCTPKTCADLGKQCDSGYSDNCGGTLDCGTCPSGQYCEQGICHNWCPDGTCEASEGENCATCPQDCGCATGQKCYHDACCTPKTCAELGKQCDSGYSDNCGGTLDCGTCPSGQYCEQGICHNWCGDGTCEADKGENCATCPQDCGCATGQKCYNNACCTPKTCLDLGKQCDSGYNDTCGGTLDCGTCPSGQYCEQGICHDWCGDGTCEASEGENCATCPQDCGCATGQKCYHDACCTPKTCQDLGKLCGQWDNSCGGTVDCGDGTGACNSPPECRTTVGAFCSPTTGTCYYPPAPNGTLCGSHHVVYMQCCHASCVNLDTDPNNCGGCGIVCKGNQKCMPCFAAGTKVRLADGNSKAIEKLRAGDRVMGFDIKSHKLVPATISKTFVHPANATQYTLIINGNLRATPNHPFYSNDGWVRADHLKVGDKIIMLTADGFKSSTIKSIKKDAGHIRTYNIEVNGVHDYFANGILVHNKWSECKNPNPNPGG